MDNNNICEYSGLPNTQSYVTNPQAEGAGVGGESIKENFIDSVSDEHSKSEQQSESDEQTQTDKLDKIYEKMDIDFMYNWIRKHSGK